MISDNIETCVAIHETLCYLIDIMNLNSSIYDIKFKDIQVLLELIKTRSIRELSRRLNTTPGQISKTIKSLEHRLGLTLINRSISGIESTAEAEALIPYLESLRDTHLELQGELKKGEQDRLLCFASTSFVTTHLLPKVLESFEEITKRTRFRMIDLPPTQFTSVGLRNGFQLCVHNDHLDWPKTWTSVQIGKMRWHLYCRFNHKIAKRPKNSSILKYPFVYPVYWSTEGVRFGNDGCPLEIKDRVRGHETSTATAAVEVVRHTNHLGFLPELVAGEWERFGQIRKVEVPHWEVVDRPMYLTVKNDVIKQSTFKKLTELFSISLV